jgi:AraC family transcriptional regulator
MRPATPRARRIVRGAVGAPVSIGRVPARLPLVLERHQALFESISVPPLPAPVLLVHTGGKPMDYRSSGGQRHQQSIPGLVTFVPKDIRSEVVLRGVGEGTVVFFDDDNGLPSWLVDRRHREPVTFTNDVIVAIVRRLVAELESRSSAEKYLKTLASTLLAELQRELGQPRAALDLPASRGGLRVAHTAIQHMLAHLGDPLTVTELARACGVGVTSFSSSFRQATGTTPHRYLRKARIERACELLRTTGLYIREIGEAVGFRGQSHFCSAFIAERGLTPSAYRRACRDGNAARPGLRPGQVTRSHGRLRK